MTSVTCPECGRTILAPGSTQSSEELLPTHRSQTCGEAAGGDEDA